VLVIVIGNNHSITNLYFLFPISHFPFLNSIDPVVVLTLLLHKDPVELTGHHHEKSVSNILTDVPYLSE